TGGQVARTALALLNTLFISLALGVCVSTRAQSHYQALRRALMLAAVFFVGSWLALAAGLWTKGTFAILLSPYGAFYLGMDAIYSAAKWRFWVSLCIAHGTGWLL